MRRKIGNILFSTAIAIALFLVMSGQSMALIYGTDDFQLAGKVEAKAAFFTNDAKGNSITPYANGEGWKKWDMFKERNMAYLEVSHDLRKLTGIDLQYHLVARAMYEGVYDYGPSVFKDAYKAHPEYFDKYNLKYQYGIWEAYINYKKGPLNLRVGRQNLSWGNTDVMRVIDHINPLDNTWGGTGTESLDDRRIPLWMARASFYGSNNFGFEGYLVPGAIDNTVAPNVPWGSPYGNPEPAIPEGIAGWNNAYGFVTEPPRDMNSSRVGIKLVLPGLLGGQNSNVELSYQNTYWDSPALRFSVNQLPFSLGVELWYPKVNIAGLSWNYVFHDLDFIFKGDLAHVWGEPVYINAINQILSGAQFTYKDFTNFGLSLEKNIWIRPLNSTEKIGFLLEYYGNYCHDWDERMVFPVPDPATGVMPGMKKYEDAVVLSVTSEYYMKIKAAVALLYDPSGSWMVAPTLTYRFNNPLTAVVGYSAAWGNWSTFGMGKDRDQVNVTLKYEF